MKIHSKIRRAELGAVVCSTLIARLHDHPALVGGAAASIYSRGRYLSDDLDIVSYRDRRELAPVMRELGFTEKGGYWVHPSTDLFVQFVSSPIMIGRKYVKEPERIKTAAGELPIISALDCACDRLAWYLSGDAQSLEQCADVVAAQRISFAAISRWLEGEEQPEREKQEALAALKRKVAARRHR
jgi:hypothetical protein